MPMSRFSAIPMPVNRVAELLRVELPTQVIWGLDDVALLPGLLDGLERYVPRLQLHHPLTDGDQVRLLFDRHQLLFDVTKRKQGFAQRKSKLWANFENGKMLLHQLLIPVLRLKVRRMGFKYKLRVFGNKFSQLRTSRCVKHMHFGVIKFNAGLHHHSNDFLPDLSA